MTTTLQGKPLTLEGKRLSAGDNMPAFTLSANDLSDVPFSSTSGVRVFIAVPSLDTPVCNTEVRNFNKEAAKLGALIYAVSMDLPFAQARWCAAADIKAVKTLSDYKYRQFGQATGTYIKEIGLLTRAVFVVGKNGKINYVEYVAEIANHPDYEKCYAAIKAAK